MKLALTILWMLGATLSFSLMAVGGRELAAELDTFEILFYRSLIGLPLVIAWAVWAGGVPAISTRQIGTHGMRNAVHFGAQNLWFYGIALIPLGQLVALEFTNPVWLALLAPLLLGEQLTRRNLLAVLVGFIGILIVARPGLAPIELGHLAGLGAALGFALTNITTKRLSRKESVLCILFWMTVMQAGWGLATTLPGGIAVPSVVLWPWMAAVGVAGLTAHLCLTTALALAPATIVAPLEFLRLPVIATVGALLYGEALDVAVLIGAAVIVSANLINLTAKRNSAPPG